MWLIASSAGFTAAGGAFCWFTRRRLLLLAPEAGRRWGRDACWLVAALSVAGFALAHLGMGYSWTGQIEFADVRWLGHALAIPAALLAAHGLLRLRRSGADALILPLAGFLAVVGALNVYVWETRDANAYISARALPALREYRAGVAADRSLPPSRRAALLRALGAVPNELEHERETGRIATVLDARWLAAYNASVRRLAGAQAASSDGLAGPHLREVRLDRVLRRQLFGAVLGILLVPLVLLACSRDALLGRAVRIAPLVAPWVLLALVGGVLATSGGSRLPAIIGVRGHGIVVYEFVKLALVAVLALSLRRPTRDATVGLGVAAAAAAIVLMLGHDPGAGVALLALAALMAAGAGKRTRYGLAALGALVLVAAPALVRMLDVDLAQTARARIAMWSDPWGTYHRAAVKEETARSVERISAGRAAERGSTIPRRSVASRPALESLVPRIRRDVVRLERELRWRLEGRRGGGRPLIPGPDPVDRIVLLEAERLWAVFAGSHTGVSLRLRIDEAARSLRRAVEVLADGASARSPPGPGAGGFQLQRSLFALRAGGLAGVGLGAGRPEAVPQLPQDAALAGIGEALGFAGVLLVAGALLLLVVRGVRLAGRQPTQTRALLAFGLAAALGLQGLISLGGLSGLLPFTGLTFPFVSRSGTGLVANFVAVAGIMALSARTPAPIARARSAPLMHAAAFPAAFLLALSCVGLIQLGGRTLLASPAFAVLSGPSARFVHAGDQWAAPDYRVAPGPILDRRGETLAETPAIGGGRRYPDSALATSLAHSLVQLDSAFRTTLAQGRDSPPVGPALVTTIDSEIQRAIHTSLDAEAAKLGLRDPRRVRGASVILDVQSGAILALESRPTFLLAELRDTEVWARAETRERRHGPRGRYVNRAVHGLYPPGSTFKVVTMAAALAAGLHTLHSGDFDYRRGPKSARRPDGLHHLVRWHQLSLPDGPPITDENHPELERWHFDLEQAFAWSCNVAFAEIGVELGARRLIDMARRFGFERPLSVQGLGVAVSALDGEYRLAVAARPLARSSSEIARTAFGQAEVLATPLQMARVAAAVANGGKLVQPYLVAGVRTRQGAWLERARARRSDLGLAGEHVADLRAAMRAAVTYGLASGARLNARNARPGVAGKTGTAEWSEGPEQPHSWFVGYFPAEAPRVALAVVVEEGGHGGGVAASVARRVFASDAMRAYIRGREG